MFIDIPIVWWRHDMEMLFALAVLSLENHQWPLDFLTKGHYQAVLMHIMNSMDLYVVKLH